MKSRVQKKETRWEKLDNTANLFPVIANETMTNVYRIAVILSENIEPECLQEALEQVLPWFNTMNVRMRTGMFWYYFETNVKGKPVVREEEDFPCRYIEQHRNKSYLFRVTYYKNRINLEVFHALADGMGAVNFLRELTYQYLRICYPQLSGEMGDRLCDDTSLDTEDSYLKNYKKAGKKTYKSVPAVHMKGERLVRGELGIIHGYMSVRQLKEKAKELGIPCSMWNKLQHGTAVTIDDKEYTPDMVMGAARKGLKVTYCTDSRPVQIISDNAKESDLFICEGMYGEDGKEAKAKEYKHMTFTEAAQLAKNADVREMWLTHYSPSLVRPQDYVDKARKIFPATIAANDGRTVELKFDDEG